MNIPSPVQDLLRQLNQAGFQAYAVGGCVRDSLLQKKPNDWDICTSALPEDTTRVFSHCPVIATGIKHGTITVMAEGIPYEITTFRQDGTYADHRRPDNVQFVSTLSEDLLRRDFTVNAMAADAEGHIYDPFGGREDLNNRVIRAVGDARKRFDEDALRILRGLRFAATLGFSIHPETAAAMEEKKELLRHVSSERIYSELTKLLTAPQTSRVLADHGSILTAVLPEIAPTMGFLQHNPSHHLDVWGHTLEALGHASTDPIVRWALLLHDLGKPECFRLDDSGVGHFYGHPERGEAIARKIFSRLKADTHTKETVCKLVLYHDYDAPASTKTARRWISRFGPDFLPLLLEVKRCDCLAHADTDRSRARLQNLTELSAIIQQLLQEAPCVTCQDLSIKGGDVLALGISPGPEVGRLLNLLLEDVLEERCPNQREALLRRLLQYCGRKDTYP